MYDIIILGGGPAGTTAAVYVARKKINALLFSKDLGGQVNWTMGIENYMGFQYVEGPELMLKFEQQMKRFPIDVRTGVGARSLSRRNGSFLVTAEDGQVLEAKSVIVATGKRPRALNVPGEQRLVGRGLSYCAVCDGPLFEGRKVAVVGGGNSALGAVADMVKIAEHVYLVTLTCLTGDPVLAERAKAARNLTLYADHAVEEIIGQDMVEGIRIRPASGGATFTVAVAGVFVEIGLQPNSGLVKGLASLNEYGEIKINPRCETDVPGLFAAGDVTDVPEKQIVIAAGEGAKAALQAHKYLQRLG